MSRSEKIRSGEIKLPIHVPSRHLNDDLYITSRQIENLWKLVSEHSPKHRRFRKWAKDHDILHVIKIVEPEAKLLLQKHGFPLEHAPPKGAPAQCFLAFRVVWWIKNIRWALEESNSNRAAHSAFCAGYAYARLETAWLTPHADVGIRVKAGGEVAVETRFGKKEEREEERREILALWAKLRNRHPHENMGEIDGRVAEAFLLKPKTIQRIRTRSRR